MDVQFGEDALDVLEERRPVVGAVPAIADGDTGVPEPRLQTAPSLRSVEPKRTWLRAGQLKKQAITFSCAAPAKGSRGWDGSGRGWKTSRLRLPTRRRTAGAASRRARAPTMKASVRSRRHSPGEISHDDQREAPARPGRQDRDRCRRNASRQPISAHFWLPSSPLQGNRASNACAEVAEMPGTAAGPARLRGFG